MVVLRLGCACVRVIENGAGGGPWEAVQAQVTAKWFLPGPDTPTGDVREKLAQTSLLSCLRRLRSWARCSSGAPAHWEGVIKVRGAAPRAALSPPGCKAEGPGRVGGPAGFPQSEAFESGFV